VISHLFTNKTSHDIHVTYFFPRLEDSTTFAADVVLKSIAQQLLRSKKFDNTVVPLLEKLQDPLFANVAEIRALLETIIDKDKDCYMVIDALDEFDKRERDILFAALSSTMKFGRLKLFLTERASVAEVAKTLQTHFHQTMSGNEVSNDISTYVRDTIDLKIANEDLVVQDQSLVVEIKDRLIEHAQGM